MDHQNGGYGYPPYDEEPRTTGQNTNAPHAYRDDPAAYKEAPLQQGDSDMDYDPAGGGYDGRGYSVRQAPSAYADSENPYAPHPIDANYGYDYNQQPQQPADGYAAQQGYYAQQPSDGYSAQQGYYPQQPAGEYGTQQEYYSQQPQQGYYSNSQQPTNNYTERQQSGGYYEAPGGGYPPHRQFTDYAQHGASGRINMPVNDSGYEPAAPRSGTGRTQMPDGVEEYTPRANTSRTRYPRSEDDYAREGGDEMDLYDQPRASSGKKKRSKFAKFMHALGLYLAQMPTKTLVIIGGTFAMALAAVILLAVLLPNSGRTERADDGQLAISDITPTPSLAPTDTPAPTEEASPSPSIAVLTDNIATLNSTSPLIPDIQKRLVELGYMDEPEGGYTDKFGPSTKTAIRLFQVKNFSDSHDWDGIIGNGTYSLLMSDDAKAYYLSRGDGDSRTNVITKLVEDVTTLQNRLIQLGYLTGSATGLYGSTTVQAVQKFQEYHGLSPIDGIAGQETLKLIYSTDAMDAVTGAANNKTKLGTTSPSVSPSVSPSTSPTTP